MTNVAKHLQEQPKRTDQQEHSTACLFESTILSFLCDKNQPKFSPELPKRAVSFNYLPIHNCAYTRRHTNQTHTHMCTCTYTKAKLFTNTIHIVIWSHLLQTRSNAAMGKQPFNEHQLKTLVWQNVLAWQNYWLFCFTEPVLIEW